MAKPVAYETAEAAVPGANPTLGGYGYLEKFRIAHIYEGTSDTQRMVIARAP